MGIGPRYEALPPVEQPDDATRASEEAWERLEVNSRAAEAPRLRLPQSGVVINAAMAQMHSESDEAMRPVMEAAERDIPFTQAS